MLASQSNILSEMSMLIRGSGECEQGEACVGWVNVTPVDASLGSKPPSLHDAFTTATIAAKWSRELEMRTAKDTTGISLYYVLTVILGCERVNGRHKYCKNNGSVQLNRVISAEHRWPLPEQHQTCCCGVFLVDFSQQPSPETINKYSVKNPVAENIIKN